MRHTKTALCVVAMLVLPACGVAAQRHADIVDNDNVPFLLLETDPPTTVQPTTTVEPEPVTSPLTTSTTVVETDSVTLCFVRDGHLAVVQQQLVPPVSLEDAIGALSQPPKAAEPLRTALSDTSIVRDINLVGGIAGVDLRQDISSLGGDDQLLAVAQIVCTLTGRPGVGQVSFTLEGTPVDVPRGDGSLVAGPLSRDDYSSLLP